MDLSIIPCRGFSFFLRKVFALIQKFGNQTFSGPEIIFGGNLAGKLLDFQILVFFEEFLEMDSWCTIESDPGVFTELVEKIGCPTVALEEVYTLDDAVTLENLQPIYGLIFLFKWQKNPQPRECLQVYDNELIFFNQVINNACATQAILSILLNIPDLQMANDLQEFKNFCGFLDPHSRGLAIGECEFLRTSHNSFSKPEPFVYSQDKRRARDDDDVFHFISYIPFRGKVPTPISLNLTGLRIGRVARGSYPIRRDH